MWQHVSLQKRPPPPQKKNQNKRCKRKKEIKTEMSQGLGGNRAESAAGWQRRRGECGRRREFCRRRGRHVGRQDQNAPALFIVRGSCETRLNEGGKDGRRRGVKVGEVWGRKGEVGGGGDCSCSLRAERSQTMTTTMTTTLITTALIIATE